MVFFLKYSRLFIIDRFFYVVFMIDMYCLVNVILIVGGGEFGMLMDMVIKLDLEI